MRRHWVLSLVLAVGAALVAAPTAQAGDGFFTSQDLTGAIAAPIGRTEPSGWSTPWDLKRHFAYVSEDRQLIVASAGPDGAWSWTVATTNGGYIFGYLATYSYAWDHSSHIVYTNASTSHLMETWSSEASPRWQTVDLTETYHGPKAKVSPRGYEQDGQQHLFFKEYDAGAIWEATFVPGTGWGFTNLTSRAGIPPNSRLSSNLAGSPLGADGEAVGYIGADGYPHVLAGQHGRWIDQRVGVPGAMEFSAVNSMALLRDGHSVRYVLQYSTGDFHLHEAAWEGGRWTDTDIAAALPQLDPNRAPDTNNGSYLWNADGSEHMFTTDADGAAREYVRTRDGAWVAWRDTEAVPDGADWVAAFTAPDDTVHGTETEFFVYYTSDRHVIVADLTAPYQA